MKITRIGLSMFRIETEEGLVLLTDPWIVGNPTTPKEFKTPEYLQEIDVLLVSHGHSDHANGVVDVSAVNRGVKTVCPFELGFPLRADGVENIVQLNVGGSAEFGKVKVTMVPAVHSSSYGMDRVYSGPSTGFVITLENGYKIYYSGDTGLTADMKLVVKDYFNPDLVILPVGGVITMDPDQAAYAATQLLEAKHVIPCHYFPSPQDAPEPQEMENFLNAVPMISGLVGNKGAEFERRVKEISPSTKVSVLNIGESLEINHFQNQ